MPATSLWPHWTVTRAVATLAAGREHIDPEQLAAELDCDLEEAMAIIGEALHMRPPGGCILYCRREAH